MATTTDNQRKILIAAGIIIALLMGVIAYLLYNKYGNENTIQEQKKELNESVRLQAELEEEYQNAMAELDELLDENEGLRAEVEVQRAELEKQKNRISEAIRKGESSAASLATARREITQLKAQQQAFLTKIDELERTNSLLSNEIVQVKEEKKVVEEEVIRTKEERARMEAAKDSVIQDVTEEKKELEQEKAFLEEKVDIASVIKVDKLEVAGYKTKESGKMKRKRYAKNTDMLKICFTATANAVAEPGTEEFLVRLISPLGESLYVENLGSGTFINKDSREEMRYTKAQNVPYDNRDTEQCLNWKPDTPFARGEYQVEVFNKGYKVGSTAFELK